MATLRERRTAYLRRNGFLPGEARELSRTSRDGLRAPYFQYWIRSRRRLYDNAIRYGWTDRQYRDYIKKQYEEVGGIKYDALGRPRADVWLMLRHLEEKAFRRGEEYESPWKKRGQRREKRKRDTQRVTRRQFLQSAINRVQRSLSRTKNPDKREFFEGQIREYQKQLNRLA